MTSRRRWMLTAFVLSASCLSSVLPSGELIRLADAAEASTNAVVSQLIFSGRPDPRWTIGDPARQQLPEFLTGVPPVSPPDWPQFGCRGFQVLNLDPSLDFPPLVRVFREVIEIGSSYFADVNGLASFLASTIPAVFDSNGNGVVDRCEGLP